MVYMAQVKKQNKKYCHQCSKELKRPLEDIFSHCFECGLKRLEKLTPNFEPCNFCRDLQKSR